MAEIINGKCSSCGAKIESTGAPPAKCSYCDSVFTQQSKQESFNEFSDPYPQSLLKPEPPPESKTGIVLAVVALVLGILSLISCFPFIGVFGLIFGIMAIVKCKGSPKSTSLAIVGLLGSIIGTSFSAIMFIIMLIGSSE